MEDSGLEIKGPGEEGDYLVLRWWAQLRESGELLDVFAAHAGTPGGFLGIFNAPNTVLFYRLDEKGVCLAIWFEPFMGNVALGLWARPDFRHRGYWRDVIEAHRLVFQHTPLVVFVTKRPHVIEASKDFGYTTLDTIPYFFRGEAGALAYLTKEEFVAKHG